MISSYKRGLALVLALLIFSLLFSCDKLPSEEDGYAPETDGFSVHYLDVGQGDCSLIRFSDGVVLVIDTGDRNLKTYEAIKNYFKSHGVEKIDYLMITHPDSDHVGNAVNLLNDFIVDNVFIPYLYPSLIGQFPYYQEAYEIIKEKSVKINYSDSFDYIKGEDYSVALLSPYPAGIMGSAYDQVNGQPIPEDKYVNDLSPIIYVESCGYRFIFTGDAGYSQEQIVINDYQSGVYDKYFSKFGIDVKLDGIDFLKLAHHGADGSSGIDFLSLLKPKNAVISVGGDNYYGHPSSETLLRLYAINPDCMEYRTSVCGWISVQGVDKIIRINTQRSF